MFPVAGNIPVAVSIRTRRPMRHKGNQRTRRVVRPYRTGLLCLLPAALPLGMLVPSGLGEEADATGSTLYLLVKHVCRQAEPLEASCV